jgi:hypothetical protein
VLVAAASAIACGSDGKGEGAAFEPGCEDVALGTVREFEAFAALGCTKVKSLSLRVGGSEFETLAGLEHLETITGDFWLISGTLKSLDGLEGLKSGGALHFGPAGQLASLAALRSLVSAEEIHVVHTVVETLDGLQNLRDVRRLEIADNVALRSLSPIDAWPEGTVSDAIAVRDNVALPQCDVDAFFLSQAPSSEECETCAGNSAAACSAE